MANEVRTQIIFENPNKELVDKLYELYNNAKIENKKTDFIHYFREKSEEPTTLKDSNEIIGAKWSYIDEMGEDYITIVSANYYPKEGIERLLNILTTIQSDLKTKIIYEEEELLERGLLYFKGTENVLEDIQSKEDIIDWICSKESELRGQYNFEDEEWISEEAEELFNEIIYEKLEESDIELIEEI